MWWRTLGVALVLLALGLAGGYAVADRTAAEPVEAGVPEPVPAVSPAVPTPAPITVEPDPDIPALAPGVPLEPTALRPRPRAAGLTVSVPVGWPVYRQPTGYTWQVVSPDHVPHSYLLRVGIPVGNLSVTAAKRGRIAALETAEETGGLSQLVMTEDDVDGFEATYVDEGYRQVTVERWVSFGEGDTAYAGIAVTGRTVDAEGMRDLLTRVADSTVQLPPVDDDDS